MYRIQTKIISIKNLIEEKEPSIIILSKKIEALEEIYLSFENNKKKEIGHIKTNTSRSVNFSISDKKNQNLGSEIAKKFKLKKQSSLKEFSFYINENTFKTITFRINIYNIKKENPYNLIHNENIIINISNHKKGWISVDLSPYNIVTKESIIISVEWIDYEGNKNSKLSLPITIPKLFSSHYYKFGRQGKWKKYNNISSAMKLSYVN